MSFEKEFKSIQTLTGDAALYFNVPISLIADAEMHAMRISLFCYLSIYRGMNNRLCFSVPHFVKWAGYKNDRRIGGMNDKVLTTLDLLNEWGYVTYCDDRPISRTGCVEIEFNRNLVYETTQQESFGILYWDEVQKIIQYRNENPHDRYLDGNVVLLVFAFLRQAIFRLPNKLKPEERSPEGIANRRKRCFEAYNESYKDIGAVLGLRETTVSRAIKVLEQLKLIVTAEPYHIKNEIGDFRTPDIIFANAYKRDGNELLAEGDDYALGEIKRKEESLRNYIPAYRTRRKKTISA